MQYEIATFTKLGTYLPVCKWKDTFFKSHIQPKILGRLGLEYHQGDTYAKTALYDSGSFGNIYRLQSAKDNTELSKVLKLYKQCPQNQDKNQKIISAAIRSWHAKQSPLSLYFLQYDYYPRGFLDWSTPQKEAPFLLMEYTDAIPLSSEYLKAQNPESIKKLAEDFLNLMKELDKAGVGHGDISPGNLLVKMDDQGVPHIILVDYDDLYIPKMGHGLVSTECGKPAYQHKSRRPEHTCRLDKTIHYFSSIVFYLTLLVLCVDPVYKERLSENGMGDVGLLFREEDLRCPETSELFRELKSHSHDMVRFFAAILYEYAVAPSTRDCKSLPQVLEWYFSMKDSNRKNKPGETRSNGMKKKFWEIFRQNVSTQSSGTVQGCSKRGSQRELKKTRGKETNDGEHSASAKNWIGWCYQYGLGVEKDLEKAVEWYTKAANDGDVQAKFNLGMCSEKGFGVPKNPGKALYWYTEAAKYGHAAARKRRIALKESLKP